MSSARHLREERARAAMLAVEAETNTSAMIPGRELSIPDIATPYATAGTVASASVTEFVRHLIRALEIRASEIKDRRVMAGYLGAIQTAKLLALTVDPTGLKSLTKEADGALKRMRKTLKQEQANFNE